MPRLLFTTPAQQKQPHLLNQQKFSPYSRQPLNQQQKINRRKSVLCLPLRPAQRMKQPALKHHRFSAACAVFLTGGKSRTSEPSVIQEKKPTEAETATEEVAPPSPPENSPEDTSSAEPDTIIFAPRRPDSPQRHNLDEIIKNLEHEEFPDRTALYRVDGEPAFPGQTLLSRNGGWCQR